MRRLYSSLIKSVALCAMAAAALPAFSAEKIESGDVAQCNKTYVFTPSADGYLQITGRGNYTYTPEILFNTEELDFANTVYPYNCYYGPQGWVYYFLLKADTDYYFHMGFLKLEDAPPTYLFKYNEGPVPNEVAWMVPDPTTSTAYNLANCPELRVWFMRQETFTCQGDAASLVYTTLDGSRAETPVQFEPEWIDATRVYNFDIRSAIVEVKSKMKDFSDFTIIARQPKVGGQPLSGEYVNEDGDLELVYFYEAQTSIVKAVYPEEFLSFWPLDDPAGIMSFTFDGPLAPMDKQEDIMFRIFAGPYRDGDDEGGGWPQLPAAPVEIEGNVLSVNLTNVVRTTDKKTVSILISGVVDINGENIDYNGSGAIAIYDIPYILIPETTLTYELTPESGSLNGVESLELWMAPDTFEHVKVDGFTFTAEGLDAPVEIAVSETNPVEEEGAMVYTIPVPGQFQTAVNVHFSVVLTSLDGYVYNLDAWYNVDSGVATVGSEEAGEVYYDLQGRRVMNPDHGIYILNGRKVVK